MDLGVGDNSEAVAINDSGHVVGNRSVPMASTRPFLWRDGQVVDLLPAGQSGRATDINSFDEVVGSRGFNGSTRAFLWRRGVLTDLGVLPGKTSSFAQAINNRGEIVGFSTVPGGDRRAFRWHAGVMTDLGALPGESDSLAFGVNIAGTVVGNSGSFNEAAVRWDRAGAIERLTDVRSSGTAINDLGAVTGVVYGGIPHGFLWKDGQLTEIQSPPGTFFLQPEGINNKSQIVGTASHFPFLWQDGELIELPKLVGTSAASDINNHGHIVGAGSANPNGTNRHAVLWTPESPSGS